MERTNHRNLKFRSQTISFLIFLCTVVNCQADYPGHHDWPVFRAFTDVPLHKLAPSKDQYFFQGPEEHWQLGIGEAYVDAYKNGSDSSKNGSFEGGGVKGWTYWAEFRVFDWLAFRAGRYEFDENNIAVCNPQDNSDCIVWKQQLDTVYLAPVVDIYRYRNLASVRLGFPLTYSDYDVEFERASGLHGPAGAYLWIVDFTPVPYLTLDFALQYFDAEDIDGSMQRFRAAHTSLALRF